MKPPCSNPLIRIIIDDEDGDLPSINISRQYEEEHEGDDEHVIHMQHRLCVEQEYQQQDNQDDESSEGTGDEEGEHHEQHYGESLSSSVDSFIQHLDSLHPFRWFIREPFQFSCCLYVSYLVWGNKSQLWPIDLLAKAKNNKSLILRDALTGRMVKCHHRVFALKT